MSRKVTARDTIVNLRPRHIGVASHKRMQSHHLPIHNCSINCGVFFILNKNRNKEMIKTIINFSICYNVHAILSKCPGIPSMVFRYAIRTS
jgi:hypothetical protein